LKEITLILGGNIGEVLQNFYRARILINKRVGKIFLTSSIHHSPPKGYTSKYPYKNQVIVLMTKRPPLELLKTTQEIEVLLGRKTKTKNNQYMDRTMDIDILYYAKERINLPNLIIPHPRIKEREFVINPLKELSLIIRS